MTIAISMKVNDGLVLAADSASTIIASGEEGAPTVVNV
jgi:20S proteasome alpha/beta subunit